MDTYPNEEKQQEVRHTGWVTLMSHPALHPQGLIPAPPPLSIPFPQVLCQGKQEKLGVVLWGEDFPAGNSAPGVGSE